MKHVSFFLVLSFSRDKIENIRESMMKPTKYCEIKVINIILRNFQKKAEEQNNEKYHLLFYLRR